MAFQVYVDSVALPTTTGSKTVSPGSLTFTPTGAIWTGNLRTADGGGAAADWFLGTTLDATHERYEAFESEDASASSDVGVVALDTGSMTGLTTNNGVDWLADFTSFNASPAGFTYNLSNAPAAASILNFILLGGDLTVEPFVFNTGAASGNVSLNTLSGTPSCVIFYSTSLLTAADTVAASSLNAYPMTGWMCADGTQGVAGSFHQDAQAAANTSKWQTATRCLQHRNSLGQFMTATFVSMDANGFTVNVTVAAGSTSIRVYGIAIYGGTWTAGSFASSTGTGNTAVTTTGVAPKVVILQTRQSTTVGTAEENGGQRSIGAGDGTRRFTVGYDDIDAADPTTADKYLDRTKILATIQAGTPTLLDDWDLASLDSQGFTYNHTTASGSAIEVIYLVGGDAATTGVSVNVNDSVTTTESATVQIPMNVVVADSVAITEAVSFLLDPPAPLVLILSDDVAVTEGVSVRMALSAVAADSVTVTEAVSVLVNPLVPEVADAVTVTDLATVALLLEALQVSDDVAVTDAVSILVNPLSPDVFDTVTASEFEQVLIASLGGLQLDVSDSITVTDDVTATLSAWSASVSDQVAVDDGGTVALVLMVAEGDPVTVTDVATVQLQLLPLTLTVADQVSVSEAGTLANAGGSISFPVFVPGHPTDAPRLLATPLALLPTGG